MTTLIRQAPRRNAPRKPVSCALCGHTTQSALTRIGDHYYCKRVPACTRRSGTISRPANWANCSVLGCPYLAAARGWCSKHYQRWYNHGTPHTIEDLVAAFVEQRCIRARTETVDRAELIDAWEGWAQARGIRLVGRSYFTQVLRGVVPEMRGEGRSTAWYYHIGLRPK